jgi:hypothetical protein
MALLSFSFFAVADSTAHHSLAAFDLGSEISFDAVITRFDWVNPHVYIHVAREGQDGDDSWRIEAQAIAGMAREGWTSESLVPGERIRVVANPPTDPGRRIALGSTIVKADGTALFIPRVSTGQRIASGTSGGHVATGLQGRWMPRWNADVAGGFLSALTAWPLTDLAMEAMDSYRPEMNPANQCVPQPIPYRMIWPLPVTIEMENDAISIRFETGDARTVYMSGDSHESASYSVFGHSIGRWEGETLVVDTQRFSEHRSGNSIRGLPSSAEKRLVERFQLGEDGTFIHYSFRLEDPPYLEEPVTGTLELAYSPDFEFDYSPCDLESAQRYLQE